MNRNRVLAVWAVCLAAASACVAGGAAAPGRVEQVAPRIEAVTFDSAVLDGSKTFCVVLPEGYAGGGEDWPVVFLFHGRGRHERSLIEDDVTRAALLAAPFVTVLPDGDDGWYIDSPVRPADRYGAYTREVIAVADARYHLSDDPADRGLSGWSMGGYGCVRFAEAHAGAFGAVAPMIGLLDFPRTGLPEGQDYPVPTDRFGDDPAVWRRLNPLHHAERLRNMDILIITADRAFDRTMNEHFAARLDELEIGHTWRVLDGGHTFAIVREAVPIVVDFMADALASRSRAAGH